MSPLETYLQEGEGVGHVEFHLLAAHDDGLVLVKLHQVLGLVNSAELHKCLQVRHAVLTQTLAETRTHQR